MITMTKEQLDRAIALNKQMMDSDPQRYEAMQLLAMIGAVAARLGKNDLSSIAIDLSNQLADSFRQ